MGKEIRRRKNPAPFLQGGGDHCSLSMADIESIADSSRMCFEKEDWQEEKVLIFALLFCRR